MINSIQLIPMSQTIAGKNHITNVYCTEKKNKIEITFCTHGRDRMKSLGNNN